MEELHNQLLAAIAKTEGRQMGYTHYWRRPRTIDKKIYAAIVDDFSKTFKELQKHIDLADWTGEGQPWVDNNTGQVRFNGRHKCGHPENYAIVIPWPTPDAGGVAEYGEEAQKGYWFAGAEIQKRTCNGHCDYESFNFDRDMGKLKKWENPTSELWFNCCKTAFRPYDLAVITFLIIAKKHLKDQIKVSSDGTDANWFDGKMICQMMLGYGLEYIINKEGELVALKNGVPNESKKT
jgi:hypothetical protein